MKMNKILLSAALLISARAFAMDQATASAAAPVVGVAKTGILSRARTYASELLTASAAKIASSATSVWGKVPGMPASLSTKFATCRTWATGKGATVSNWVVNHTPAVVRNALTSHNLKLAGAVTAIAAVATASYFGLKSWTKSSTKVA